MHFASRIRERKGERWEKIGVARGKEGEKGAPGGNSAWTTQPRCVGRWVCPAPAAIVGAQVFLER